MPKQEEEGPSEATAADRALVFRDILAEIGEWRRVLRARRHNADRGGGEWRQFKEWMPIVVERLEGVGERELAERLSAVAVVRNGSPFLMQQVLLDLFRAIKGGAPESAEAMPLPQPINADELASSLPRSRWDEFLPDTDDY